MFRTHAIARIARPAAFAARGYADSTSGGVAKKAGEMLKSAAQAFSAEGKEGEGKIGKQFTSDGSVGQAGEQAGGTFSAKQGGSVGQEFEKDGPVGGKVQEVSNKAWDKGKEMTGEKK